MLVAVKAAHMRGHPRVDYAALAKVGRKKRK